MDARAAPGGTRAETVTGRPAPPLRPLVSSYVGYRYEGFAAGLHRGLPGSSLTIVVPVGEPLVLSAPGETAAHPYTSVVGGLHTAPAGIHHDGSQFGIQLALEPLGARLLLGVAAGELTGVVTSLDAVLGPAAVELVDRLNVMADDAGPGDGEPDRDAWAARFAVIDAVLTGVLARRRRDEPPPVADEVRWAWRRLRVSDGAVPVAVLADEVGWSRRHLSERFGRDIGLSPKTYARVLRFERATTRLRRPGAPGLATIAAEAGYYDQAHLTREFNELAGCPPTRLVADERLPSVQDADPDAGAP